jgi:hypothetical protein
MRAGCRQTVSMSSLARDCRIATRTLLRSPGLSAIAMLTFALGIGANTAIFSVVNSVLLRPLGYANSDRLVIAEHVGPSPVAPATFIDWKKQSASFEQMASAQAWGGSLLGTDRPEPLVGLRVRMTICSPSECWSSTKPRPGAIGPMRMRSGKGSSSPANLGLS